MVLKMILAAALVAAPQLLGTETGQDAGKMSLTLEADGAVATGVTPGASVMWLGVSRAREEWADHFYHWRRMTEDLDKDGVVAYPRKEGFPDGTVLLAVDLSAGTWAVGATFPLEGDVPEPDLGTPTIDGAGRMTSFTHRGPKVDILVARAGGQAWAGRVLDGGPLDRDGAHDGTVTVTLAALPARAGKAEVLDGLRPGDLVAMVDEAGPWARIGRFSGNAAGKE